MPFEPLVNPLALQADGASTADANVVELTAFARGVDGVADRPAYSAPSATFNQIFMRPLLERIEHTEPMDCGGWCPPASWSKTKGAGARARSECGCRIGEPQSIRNRSGDSVEGARDL